MAKVILYPILWTWDSCSMRTTEQRSRPEQVFGLILASWSWYFLHKSFWAEYREWIIPWYSCIRLPLRQNTWLTYGEQVMEITRDKVQKLGNRFKENFVDRATVEQDMLIVYPRSLLCGTTTTVRTFLGTRHWTWSV